ncbi:ORF43 [Plodia interpunctella granulovirus]|uniref:ORF43 n=1 Tax=Plodia interpunctella granulovirus TaxID=262175 RepID=A0A1L5JGY2_9BBAC|nr:ORF43 [Plodia interpunctella granulovirus]APO13927.1 ORF43 [Plodia interpunctella granulovirus]
MNRSVANWMREKYQCAEKEKRIRNLLISNSGLTLDKGRWLDTRIDLATIDTEELLVKILKVLNEDRIRYQACGPADAENTIVDTRGQQKMDREMTRLLSMRPVFTDVTSVREFIMQMGRALVACNRNANSLFADFGYVASSYGLCPERSDSDLIETLRRDLTRTNNELNAAVAALDECQNGRQVDDVVQAELHNRLQSCERELQQCRDEVVAVRRENADLLAKVDTTGVCDATAEQLRSELDRMKKEATELRQQLAQCQQTLVIDAQIHSDLRHQLEQCRTELHIASDDRDNYEKQLNTERENNDRRLTKQAEILAQLNRDKQNNQSVLTNQANLLQQLKLEKDKLRLEIEEDARLRQEIANLREKLEVNASRFGDELKNAYRKYQNEIDEAKRQHQSELDECKRKCYEFIQQIKDECFNRIQQQEEEHRNNIRQIAQEYQTRLEQERGHDETLFRQHNQLAIEERIVPVIEEIPLEDEGTPFVPLEDQDTLMIDDTTVQIREEVSPIEEEDAPIAIGNLTLSRCMDQLRRCRTAQMKRTKSKKDDRQKLEERRHQHMRDKEKWTNEKKKMKDDFLEKQNNLHSERLDMEERYRNWILSLAHIFGVDTGADDPQLLNTVMNYFQRLEKNLKTLKVGFSCPGTLDECIPIVLDKYSAESREYEAEMERLQQQHDSVRHRQIIDMKNELANLERRHEAEMDKVKDQFRSQLINITEEHALYLSLWGLYTNLTQQESHDREPFTMREINEMVVALRNNHESSENTLYYFYNVLYLLFEPCNINLTNEQFLMLPQPEKEHIYKTIVECLESHTTPRVTTAEPSDYIDDDFSTNILLGDMDVPSYEEESIVHH